MKKPKYCHLCGRKLVEEESDLFSIYTGKKQIVLLCPSFLDAHEVDMYVWRQHYKSIWPLEQE